MKARWISIPTLALMVMSAGLALTNEAPAPGGLVTEIQSNQALAPEALAKKIGCFDCHSIDKNVVGPSYQEVAKRYKADPKAQSALIEKVKKGGKGNWTKISHEVPMPPFSARLSAADIARLVDWVLSQGNNETK
jgi:cytochrome c